MTFADRVQAGRALAEKLENYASQENVLVLGIPRGGVPVTFEVATELNAPLDVFIVRKLGVPGHEELAFGAIARGGIRFIDREIVDAFGISRNQIASVTTKERKELARRERIYRSGRHALTVQDRIVILVDDGIATGSCIHVAVESLRKMKPRRLIVAAPVAPVSAWNRLRPEVDDLICLHTPKTFWAIGQFYEDFSQVSDQEVADLLAGSERRLTTGMARVI